MLTNSLKSMNIFSNHRTPQVTIYRMKSKISSSKFFHIWISRYFCNAVFLNEVTIDLKDFVELLTNDLKTGQL